MTTELQFAVIKDELTALVDDIIRQFLNDKDYDQKEAQSSNHGVMLFLMKSLKPSINNKEDSNSFATALSSKKEMLPSISAQPAYGILTLMDPSLSNMKMINYTASSAYSVLLHKYLLINIFRWGLEIGDWGFGSIPNIQSPIHFYC